MISRPIIHIIMVFVNIKKYDGSGRAKAIHLSILVSHKQLLVLLLLPSRPSLLKHTREISVFWIQKPKFPYYRAVFGSKSRSFPLRGWFFDLKTEISP